MSKYTGRLGHLITDDGKIKAAIVSWSFPTLLTSYCQCPHCKHSNYVFEPILGETIHYMKCDRAVLV